MRKLIFAAVLWASAAATAVAGQGASPPPLDLTGAAPVVVSPSGPGYGPRQISLGADSVTIAGHTVALGGSAALSCSDLSNAAPSCSADTTNASNITSGTLPYQQLPLPTTATPGGVEAVSPVAHQFVTGISTGGVPSLAQPTAADISGLGTLATLGVGSGLAASGGALNLALGAPALLSSVISTTDTADSGGLPVYGDALTFDEYACYNGGNSVFCASGGTITAQSGSTLTVNNLPVYIAASGVMVTGTNVPSGTTVASYTGTPGGAGTVTLSASPTGTVSGLMFEPPANVITFNNGTLTTALSMAQGSVTVTTGTAWCTDADAGMPVAIPGAGPGGTPLYTKIIGCGSATQPATTFGVADQASTAISGTATLSYGANFQTNCGTGPYSVTGITGCVGMGMLAGSWAGGGGAGATAIPVTITAVYAPGVIAVNTPGTQVVNNSPVGFVTGHDDSQAINNICAYGKSAGIPVLDVPADYYVPSLSRICVASFLVRGSGRLITTDGLRNITVAGAYPEPPDPMVVPWEAAPPPAPRRVVFPADLRQFRTSLDPVVLSTYDSLSGAMPNLISGTGTYPFALITALEGQNPGLGLTAYYPGITGGSMAGVFDGVPTATNPPCVTNTTTNWLTQVATNCPGQLWTIGGATNDDAGMAPATLLDVWAKMHDYSGLFPAKPDLIYYTNHPRTRMLLGNLSGAPVEDGAMFGAGELCSFAEVEGAPCIDGFAAGMEHIWGWSPRAMAMRRAWDVPYGTANLNTPFTYDRLVYGYSLNVGLAGGSSGAPFWANLTGGAGTDPRGPMLAFRVSPNSANFAGGYVTVRLFYNSGSNTIALECDEGDLLPGAACDDPATGAPPVTPADIQGTVTVANNGTGGRATVVLSGGATYQGCTVGGAVTVPEAGAAVAISGIGSYNSPDIDTVYSCDSTTQITLSNPATTPESYTGFVLWGTPLITSQHVTDTGYNGSEAIHFEVVADTLNVWVGSAGNALYRGTIWRPWARMPVSIYGGGTRPQLTVLGDPITGGTTFATARRIPTMTNFTDDQVIGPSETLPVSNQDYIGAEGGDGYAHNTTRYGRSVILPLYAAQDFSVGNGGVSVSVTSGAAYTVPNCLVGKVLINDTASPTITLPAWCPNSIDVVDVGGNAATDNITIALPNGATLKGANTITTAFGRRTVTYAGSGAVAN